MSAGEVNPREQRVLVLASDDADASFVRAVLSAAGLAGDFCADGDALCAAVDEGAGALVVADGALTPAKAACLQETLGRQPPWSDLPLVLLARDASHSSAAQPPGAKVDGLARGAEAECGGVSPQSPLLNVTLVERPLHAPALLCAVRAALRARRRQYEVRDLLADAQRAVRQRDEFLAMLGHELRNPLGVISSAVQILNRIGSPAREASETRDMIEWQSSHLTRIVDDLLDVARVSSGRIGLQRETVDVNELARQCFQHCAALIAGRRHEVTFAPAPQPVVVDADPVRLEQIINNLLTNAIKYTPAGGRILLGVTQEPR